MESCPYCATEIVDNLNFCVECEKQVKCLNCSGVLYLCKARCLKCGEPLKQSLDSQPEMNTYTLEEKVTKSSAFRSLKVKASDNAIGTLMGRLPFGANTPLQPLDTRKAPPANLLPALPSDTDKTITTEPDKQVIGEDRRNSEIIDSLKAEHLFTQNSDHGIIPNKTLREYISRLSSKKEKQQVFALMFVWAHKEWFDESVSHENLVAVMKEESQYDSNSRKHLIEVAKDYFKKVDNQYEVDNYEGTNKVQEIISTIQNPEQSLGVTKIKKGSKRGRPAGQHNKAELEVIKPWLEMPIEHLKDFDTRELKSAPDWVAFGLYILTKILKVQGTVEVGLLYAYLTNKFETMPIKRKAFVNRISDAKSKFTRNTNGAYFLTPEAEAEVKKLIEGSNLT